MNATLKAIQQLLRHPDAGLQMAAIRVLTAIHSREPGIHKALGELLASTDNQEIFLAALAAIEENPHEQVLRHLMRLLEHGNHQERVIEVIAKIGPKAIPPLKQYFLRVAPATQCRIVRILPRLRTSQANSFFVDCLAHIDHQVVRDAVRAFREEVDKFSPGEKIDVYAKLVNALKDRRYRQAESALSAVIISLGILGDVRAKGRLLPFTKPDLPVQVRRHALMSLACLDFSGDGQTDLAGSLYPMLNEQDWDGLVRHVVAVLQKLPLAKDDQDKVRPLLTNQHPGVRIFAISRLTMMDSAANAALIMGFLGDPDATLGGAAADALTRMPSSVPVLLKALDEGVPLARGREMVQILSAHPNRLPADRARARVKRLLELQAKGDRQFELHWLALRALRGDILQAEILRLADEAFAAGDYSAAWDRLRMLEGTELLTPDLWYRLMVASLKVSQKVRARGSRVSDPSLEHAAALIANDPKGFKQRLLADATLDDEDYLYLGFHFSERLNEERRFGADLLRHVISKWPRRQSAKAAKQKLLVEGH